MMHQKFAVAPGKQTGWKRLVGQEVPKDAYSDLVSVASASNWPSVFTDLDLVAGGAAASVPVSATYTARQLTQVCDGAQTPKATQPALDMFIPLLFW
jgi:hypothetical protein